MTIRQKGGYPNHLHRIPLGVQYLSLCLATERDTPLKMEALSLAFSVMTEPFILSGRCRVCSL